MSSQSSLPQSDQPSSSVTLEQINHMMHSLLANFGRSQQEAIQHQVNEAVNRAVLQIRPNPSSGTGGAGAGSTEIKSSEDSAPTSTLPLNSRVKLSQPSSFNGTRPLNVQSWLKEMKHYLKLNGVTNEEQEVDVAASYLKESASDWYQSLPITPRTWIEFVAEMKDRFQPLAASRTARAQLRKLGQTNMSVADYSSKFYSIIQLITDMNPADQIEWYIYGLRPAIAREVDLREPTTLHQAMTAAQKIEALLDNRRPYNFSSSSSDSRPFFSSNIRPSSSSSSSSSTSTVNSAPMELGNVTTVDNDYNTASESVEIEENEYERYLEEGDDFEPDYTVFEQLEANSEVEEQAQQLQAIQQRNQRRTAPFLSQEEFTRCMKNRLCLRCKQPGHIARSCPLRPKQQSFKRNFH
jgi:hypothetical protein